MSTAEVLKPTAHPDSPNTGLEDGYRERMADTLSQILSDTYHLVIKSHVYHWNVVGPLFKSLHELTEEHYEELFEAADTIAERIRALGYLAPSRLSAAAKFSPEASDVDHTSAISMVKDLITDHEKAVRRMREAAETAGDAGDIVTEDMLTERLTFHEKAIWMLRAIITE